MPHPSSTFTIGAWLSRMPSGLFVAAVAAPIGTPPSSGNITNVGTRYLFTAFSPSILDQSLSLVAFPVVSAGLGGGRDPSHRGRDGNRARVLSRHFLIRSRPETVAVRVFPSRSTGVHYNGSAGTVFRLRADPGREASRFGLAVSRTGARSCRPGRSEAAAVADVIAM